MKSKLFVVLYGIIAILLIVIIATIDNINISDRVLNIKEGAATIVDFDKKESYILNGEWELYKDKLIQTESIDTSTLEKEYINVSKIHLSDKSDYDVCSYKVIITGIPKGSILSTASYAFNDSYAIYFNSTLVAKGGKLVNCEGNSVNLDDVTTEYYLQDDYLEVVVECSNKTLKYTGMSEALTISCVSKHVPIFSAKSVYIFCICACAIMSLYHLIFTPIKHYGKRGWFFLLLNISAFICFTCNIKSTFYYGFLLPFSANTMRTIYLLSWYFASLIAIITIRTNFFQKDFKKLDYLILLSSLLVLLAIILIPIKYIGIISLILSIVVMASILIALIWYIVSEKKNGTKRLIIICIFTLMLCFGYEVLISVGILPFSNSILPIAFFFVSIYYIILSNHIAEENLASSDLVIELTKKIRDTEFSFLNSQIQSHFIYNTLNSIQSLCNTNPEKASELVENFSYYLRNRLEFNKLPNLISLEDEIEHIKSYVAIEKTRFGNKIKCVYELEVTDIKIPPLSLQPIVENAIKHGISKQVNGGVVIISSYQDDTNVYLKVKDNGLGFDVNSLQDTKRVGFNNIKSRLELYLDADIKIESTIGVGTLVTITIPKKSLVYNKVTNETD